MYLLKSSEKTKTNVSKYQVKHTNIQIQFIKMCLKQLSTEVSANITETGVNYTLMKEYFQQ